MEPKLHENKKIEELHLQIQSLKLGKKGLYTNFDISKEICDDIDVES